MKHFYGGTFINPEKLKAIGIEYPVKLEYYRTNNECKESNKTKVKYGIEVIKTSYTKEDVNVETSQIPKIIESETIVNRILDILKENLITPVSAEYIVEDLLKELV